MIKLLRSLTLLAFLLIFNLGNAQSKININHFASIHIDVQVLNVQTDLHKHDTATEKKDFSYNTHNSEHKHDDSDHNHAEKLSLMDIISSDEGTDFNCSGGFCMNQAHFHKKGLSIKRQLFDYFMSISC